MWQAAHHRPLAWTNHKIFHQFKIYCGRFGDGHSGHGEGNNVRTLGSLGQGGQFGVKCVNVFGLFYQNCLGERSRGKISSYIYDEDPPQQQQQALV